MGRLDVVASNAGWTRMTGFTNLDDNVLEEDWDRCFNLNVKCHLFLMHAVKQYLEETEGAFITTASAAGVKPGGSSLVKTTRFGTVVLQKMHKLITSQGVFRYQGSPNPSCKGTRGLVFSESSR